VWMNVVYGAIGGAIISAVVYTIEWYARTGGDVNKWDWSAFGYQVARGAALGALAGAGLGAVNVGRYVVTAAKRLIDFVAKLIGG